MVKMDLLQDDHHSLVSLTHTFANGEGGLLQMQVPADIGQPNITRFTLLVHGLSGDPKGNHMKKLANVTSGTYGVLEDFMLMDEEPVLGTWRIESRALRHRYDGVEYFEKSNSKTFQVDKYVLPKFDVNVNLPSYVVTTDKEMQGSITAKYTYGKPFIGTANVTADINYNGAPWKIRGDEVMVKISLDLNGNAKFTIPFDQLLNEVDPYSYQPLVEKLAGYQLIIRVKVTESLNNVTREATGSVLFYKEPFRVSFARDSSPTFFKPGLPYVGHIGEVVDFQLLGAVPLGKVFYYVITNDHVTLSGALDSISKTEHIHFQVRDDMKPYSKLIVYYFTTDSWNADSIHFVAKTSADVFQNKISMSFDKTQAEPAENVSLQISTDADSLVNILAVDQSVLLL
ncbi:CD109-like protein, partial [Mya arenaria]